MGLSHGLIALSSRHGDFFSLSLNTEEFLVVTKFSKVSIKEFTHPRNVKGEKGFTHRHSIVGIY